MIRIIEPAKTAEYKAIAKFEAGDVEENEEEYFEDFITISFYRIRDNIYMIKIWALVYEIELIAEIDNIDNNVAEEIAKYACRIIKTCIEVSGVERTM